MQDTLLHYSSPVVNGLFWVYPPQCTAQKRSLALHKAALQHAGQNRIAAKAVDDERRLDAIQLRFERKT